METTLTPFLRGKIRVHQPARGYRFNVDSVLLAGFAWTRDGERVLDLGTGSGILLLLLAHFHHPGALTGVEIQPQMASLARRNLEENGLSERGAVVEGDLRDPGAVPAGAFDLVVSNPPYFEAGRGMASPHRQRAVARHGAAASLGDVLAAGERALGPRGRLCLVVREARLPDLLGALPALGLHPRLLRPVRDSELSGAHLVLLQARREPGPGCLSLPPLALFGPDRTYTAEVLPWMGERAPHDPRFFCDVMVGKLARYLRLLGYDAAYARSAEDGWLLQECARSGRILLTRDRPLLARAKRAGVPALDPGSDRAAEQLAAIRSAFTPPAGRRPRCLACNAETMAVDREEARGKVPPYTYLTHRWFAACPCCGTLTWEGSHLERFKETVTRG